MLNGEAGSQNQARVTSMTTATIDVPDELIALLAESRLRDRPLADQIRIALSIHLFQEEMISIGKAAELAGEPRVSFERLLAELAIPPVQYDEEMYEQDLRSLS